MKASSVKSRKVATVSSRYKPRNGGPYDNWKNISCVIVQDKDKVPRTISERKIVRRLDEIGGEKVVVLTHGTDTGRTRRLAEQLRDTVLESGVTVSYGVAHYPNNKNRFPENLIRLSKEALYVAKRNGKNQVVNWEESMGGN